MAAARTALEKNVSPLIHSAKGKDDASVLDFDAVAQRAGLPRSDAARSVGSCLAEVMRRILDRSSPKRVVVAGGDSTGEVASALQIEALTVVAGLSTGAPPVSRLVEQTLAEMAWRLS